MARSTGFAFRVSIRQPVSQRCSATKRTAAGRSAPTEPCLAIERRYRPGRSCSRRVFARPSGSVLVTDFMPLPLGRDVSLAPDRRRVDLVRIIQGEQRQRADDDGDRSSVSITAAIVPWVRRRHDGLSAIAGPDALLLRTPVDLVGRDETTISRIHDPCGRDNSLHAELVPLASGRASGLRRFGRAKGSHRALAKLEPTLRGERRVARRGNPLAPDLESPHLSADRRHRRRTHNVAAGKDRRRA